MSIYYVDSSALLKRHVSEVGTSWIKHLMQKDKDHTFITSSISVVEVYSALNRRRRELRISKNEYKGIVNDVVMVFEEEYELIEISSQIVEHARHILEFYPLRAYDAVQLASAVIARDSLLENNGNTIVFLSADKRLLDAARSEGFATDNPNDHP